MVSGGFFKGKQPGGSVCVRVAGAKSLKNGRGFWFLSKSSRGGMGVRRGFL